MILLSIYHNSTTSADNKLNESQILHTLAEHLPGQLHSFWLDDGIQLFLADILAQLSKLQHPVAHRHLLLASLVAHESYPLQGIFQ